MAHSPTVPRNLQVPQASGSSSVRHAGPTKHTALVIGVHAESGETRGLIREIQLEIGLQPPALVLAEDPVQQLARVLGGQRSHGPIGLKFTAEHA